MKNIKLIFTMLGLVIGMTNLQAQCSTAPIINSFSPNTGYIGSTVTIFGANFDANNIANNVVYFGATKAQVTSASFGQLEVIVPVGASTERISVTNQCKLTAYSKVPFNGIFCPTPLTSTTYQNNAQILSISYGAYNMIAVDLDLDGKAEVISSGQGNGLSIAVNNSTPGNINFGLLQVGFSGGTIYTADLDGDGRKDIIGRYGSYLNTSSPGNISFGASTSNQNVSSYQIAAGDFNNDGKIDLVGEYGNSLWAAENLSSGPGSISFSGRKLLQAGIGRATGIQTADVDGDGKIDILISQGNYNRAMTFRNITPTGSSTFVFEPGETWSTGGSYPYRCQIADFNKDGKMDLTTCNYSSGTTAILINSSTVGDIVMSTLIVKPSFRNNYRIQVGDVDGDGYPDIVTKSLGVNQFAVYKNTTTSPSSITFANPIYYSSSARAEVSGIVIGDLDGDYVPDIATSGTSSRQIRFHRNTSAQQDVNPPTAICKNIILPLNPSGNASLTPNMIDNGSSDACGLGSITISKSSFNCTDIGPNQVTLVVTDQAGNVDSCVATVNVQPAAIIASGQTTVCQGETVTMNANQGDSYQWKLNGVNIPGATGQQYIANTSGDYTVIVTNSQGCSGESVPTTVVVNDNPTVDVSPDGTVYLCNGTRELTASQSSIYQWRLNGANIPNATQQIYTASIAGTYSVEVVDLFGCTAVSNDVTVIPGDPEIDLSGNNSSIANGDNTPSAADGTDYGQAFPNQNEVRQFTISNSGVDALTVQDVFLSGADGGTSFVVSGISTPLTISGNSSATFSVTFNDSPIRAYSATVNILSNDCDEGAYSFDLAAEITCQPASISSDLQVVSEDADAQCSAAVSYLVDANGSPAPSLSYVFSGATTGSGSGSGSGSVFALGTTSVIVTATNACGSAQDAFDVIVSDNQAPNALCQDVTVVLDANGHATIEGASSDQSIYSEDFTSNANAGNTTSINGWNVLYGNIDIGTWITAIPGKQIDLGGNVNAKVETANAIALDPGSYSLSFDYITNSNPNPNNSMRLTLGSLIDQTFPAPSSVQSESIAFTVSANSSAKLALEELGTNDNSGTFIGNIRIVKHLPGALMINNGSNDNCGIASVTASQTDFDCSNVGSNSVTLTVVDVNGNVATCTSVVTVEDNEAPIAICQDVTLQLNAQGTVVLSPSDIDNGSNDVCGISSLMLAKGDDSFIDQAIPSSSWTNNNNSSGHGQSFTAPTSGVLTSISLKVAASESNKTILFYQDASGSGTAWSSATPIYSETGVSLVGDPSGATWTTVQLSTPMQVVAGQHYAFVIDGNTNVFYGGNFYSGGAFIWGYDLSSGCCAWGDMAFQANIERERSAQFTMDCSTTGVNPFTLEVTDASGNTSTCNSNVTIEDNIAPVITCPADIAVNTDAGVCGAAVIFEAMHSDNCSSEITYSHVSGSVFPLGTTTVTATATDPSGNNSSCSFDIVVTDNEAPVITCPADISVNNDLNVCGAVVTYEATSTDNCSSEISYSHASGDLFPVGTTTVTATATDPSGNATSCSFDIVVTDDEAPDMSTQNISVTLVNGSASIVASDIDGGTTDECGIANLSVDLDTWSCEDIGEHTVTLTATDIHNNTASATATVTVIGEQPSCSISSAPTSNVNTGGDANILYIGYGAQSTVLNTAVNGGNNFTYTWTGANLDCYNCANPTFSPTSEGNYSFSVNIVNEYGCETTCTISICVYDVRVYNKKGKLQNGKVQICHVPPGNPGNAHTIEVGENAVAAHLAHGCTIGACDKGDCNSLDAKSRTDKSDQVSNEESIIVDEFETELIIYPNPSAGEFFLNLKSMNDEEYSMTVYDALGKVIMTDIGQPNTSKKMNLQVDAGVYMIEVLQGTERSTVRFIRK